MTPLSEYRRQRRRPRKCFRTKMVRLFSSLRRHHPYRLPIMWRSGVMEPATKVAFSMFHEAVFVGHGVLTNAMDFNFMWSANASRHKRPLFWNMPPIRTHAFRFPPELDLVEIQFPGALATKVSLDWDRSVLSWRRTTVMDIELRICVQNDLADPIRKLLED